MNDEIVVEIGAEPVSDISTGEWCATCALPSGWSIDVALVIDGRPLSVQTYRGCTECEQS